MTMKYLSDIIILRMTKHQLSPFIQIYWPCSLSNQHNDNNPRVNSIKNQKTSLHSEIIIKNYTLS